MDSIRVTLFVFLALISSVVSAGTAENLYTSEQLVPQQHGQPTLKQVRQGLSDVLVKVAGSRSVLAKPVVLERSRDAKRMLQQFGYRAARKAISSGSGSDQVAYILKLDFDERAVNDLLAMAGERPLGSVRPSVVVWLAAQQQGGRDYVSPDSYIYDKVVAAADKRGLPLRQPLLDLTDQRALPLSDLWGLFDGSVQRASERYAPDAILAGRLLQTSSGRWQMEWQLLDGDKQERFTTRGSLNGQIPNVMEKVADQLFAALQGSGFTYRLEGLTVKVGNVNSLSDYIDIVDYLKTIPAVTAVHTASMSENMLELTIELNGNLEQFENALALQPRLIPSQATSDDLVGMTLNYYWQR